MAAPEDRASLAYEAEDIGTEVERMAANAQNQIDEATQQAQAAADAATQAAQAATQAVAQPPVIATPDPAPPPADVKPQWAVDLESKIDGMGSRIDELDPIESIEEVADDFVEPVEAVAGAVAGAVDDVAEEIEQAPKRVNRFLKRLW